MSRADEILAFWFGTPGEPAFEAGREVWFKPARAFDEQIRERFFADYEAARSGIYDAWIGAAQTCLALIVTLDQFPRNLFRNSPRSYECDERALSIARRAVAQGFDRRLRPLERSFIYLPYEHSEDLAAQKEGVELFHGLATYAKGAEWLDYAVRHMRIIERFGRFPHRNAALGRASTPEEVEFLKDPNSSFLRVPTD